MTRGIAAASAAAMAVLLLSACGADADQVPADRAAESVAATSTPSAPTATSDAAGDAAGGDVPARADQDEVERMIAEATFLAELDDEAGLSAHSDDELVAAGDLACDAMDRGDDFRTVLIVIAAMLPRAGSTDDVAVLGGVASGTLCPEHVAYVD